MSGGDATKDAAAPSGGGPIDAGTGASGGTADASTGSSGGGTPDASTGSTGGATKDAGTMPSGGGTGAHCANTPSYPTADACSQCICSKCGSQVGSCYASGDATKDMQCAKVQACAESKHCASTSCYCGSSLFCLTPNGSCLDVIQSATGSTSPTDVQAASNDTSTALGRANAIGTCSLNSCKSECGL